MTEAFFQLCTAIRANIELDLLHNVLAKQNDESHLNKWFVSNPTIPATPDWAYADGYRNLVGLQPRIAVIHKPLTFKRIPSEFD